MATKLSAKRLDQFMLRLPDGMRDTLAKLADANGRSMNAEIIAALEQHLSGLDRLSAVEAFIAAHRKSIESLSEITGTVKNLELGLSGLQENLAKSRQPGRMDIPPGMTFHQIDLIRTLLIETGIDEKKLLKDLRAPSLEEIHDFEGAVAALIAYRQRGE